MHGPPYYEQPEEKRRELWINLKKQEEVEEISKDIRKVEFIPVSLLLSLPVATLVDMHHGV